MCSPCAARQRRPHPSLPSSSEKWLRPSAAFQNRATLVAVIMCVLFHVGAKASSAALQLDLSHHPDVAAVREWIDAERIAVLNVAGPRESGRPGIGRDAATFLARILGAGA